MEEENKKAEGRKINWFSKTKIRLYLICAAVLVLFGAGFFTAKKITKVSVERKNAMVSRQLENCSELVTLKYRYSEIVSIKKSKALSKSYSIVRYSGVIRAGISNIDFIDFRIKDNVLEMILPDVEILGNDISSLEVFDEQKSMFVPISTQEIFDEIEDSRKAAEEKAMEEGLLSEARLQTERVIRAVFISAGFDNVIFY